MQCSGFVTDPLDCRVEGVDCSLCGTHAVPFLPLMETVCFDHGPLWTTITRALIKGGCCSWHVVIRFRPKCLTKWGRSSPTGQHLICFYWASQSFMFDKVSACMPSTLSPPARKNKYCLPLCHPLTAAATSSERWAAWCWEVSTGCFFFLCYKLRLPQASPLNNFSAAFEGVQSPAVALAWN